MPISKQDLISALPISAGELTLRLMQNADCRQLADWPAYQFPYEGFDLCYKRLTPDQWEAEFFKRHSDPNRIMLIADSPNEAAVAYFTLIDIDWKELKVGNIGFRVKPTCCDKGIGTAVMRTAANWSFSCGINLLRLDVAGCNARAIRCYEKCGFVKTGEFWRDDDSLANIDLEDSRYDFLRPHVRLSSEMPKARFHWMELSAH